MNALKAMNLQLRTQVGKRLRERIDKKGVKHRYIADRIGVSRSYLSKVLKGDEFLSNEALFTIASILGTSVDNLLADIQTPDLVELITSEYFAELESEKPE